MTNHSPNTEQRGTPLVDALMARWDDDGATRGPAFIELRELARNLERATQAAPAHDCQPDDDSDAEQHWDKLDGATAWHVIDRHADNWSEIGAQMEAWGRARFGQAAPASPEPASTIDLMRKALTEIAEVPTDQARVLPISTIRNIACRALADASDRSPASPNTGAVSLFDRKLDHLQSQGFEVIGRILHKDGQYALFDQSCRWLTQPQYWRLMHEQDGSLFATPSPRKGGEADSAAEGDKP